MRSSARTCSSTICETDRSSSPQPLPEIADLHVEALVRRDGIPRAAAVELAAMARRAAAAGPGSASLRALVIGQVADVLGGQLAAEGRSGAAR
jgi:hypothetical protein